MSHTFFVAVVTVGLAWPGPALADEPPAPPPLPVLVPPIRDWPEPRLSVGVGYPELRLRAKVWRALDAELKADLDEHAQAYSTRLYVRLLQVHHLSLLAGLELGVVEFKDLDTLSGSGKFFEPLAGFQYRLASWLSVAAELGPLYLTLDADDVQHSTRDWVFSSGLYFHVL